MALTLDDIMAAPSDPDELQKHLIGKGLIPSPLETPTIVPQAQVGPLSPVTTPSDVAPMVPPKATGGGTDWLAKETTGVKPMKKEQQIDAPGLPGIGSAAYTENQLQRLEDQKEHPWGTAENHPGVLGKIGHVASRVGNIAADILAPGLALNVPGSDMNKMAEEHKLKNELTARTEAEQQGKTRELQQEEAKTHLAKEQNEQNLEKDAQGNVVGWTDAKGQKHAIDEEGTPQAIKDIAEASANKEGPRLEKSANGDIVQIKTDKDGNATSQVVYHGQPGVKTETRSIVGADGHAHDKIFDVTPNSPNFGKELADLGRAKEDKTVNDLAKEKSDEEIVIGYDKNGQQKLMSRAQAKQEGLQHIVKSSDKDRGDALQNAAALNDMGAKVKNAVKSSEGIDKLSSYQKTLIQTALRGHPDDMSTRLAVSLMDPLAKSYYTDVFSLREAALALPKQTTGGSRVSEPQATALFNTVPGSAGDHKLRLMQLRKFDENLGRLWRKVPAVEGTPQERPFGNETGGGGGGTKIKMGGKDIDVRDDGTFDFNGHEYKTTPGSKQATLVK